MTNHGWVCSNCGAGAFYDGRCGDGPVLLCGCDKGEWVNDGRGGYHTNPTGAKPVQGSVVKSEKTEGNGDKIINITIVIKNEDKK